MKGCLSNRQFDLESLEPRVLLSAGGALAGAAAAGAGGNPSSQFHESVQAGEMTPGMAASQSSLAYDPQAQVDSIFNFGTETPSIPAESKSQGTTPQTAPTDTHDASEPASAAQETARTGVASKSSTASGSPNALQEASAMGRGTDSTLSNPQPERLTQTLRSANSPPAFSGGNPTNPAFSSLLLSSQSADGAFALPFTFSNGSVSFYGTASADTLYLRVNGGQLEFSATGIPDSYTSDLDPNTPGIQPLTITAATRITVNLGGGDDPLTLDASLTAALKASGGSLSFEGGDCMHSLAGPAPDTSWWVIRVNP